mgnify:CR=1 FL=1
MHEKIILVALLFLIAGCVEITPKNRQPQNDSNTALPAQPQGTGQNTPQSDQNNLQAWDLNYPQQPTLPLLDQNSPTQADQNQPQQQLPPPQPLPPLPIKRPAWVELLANTKPIYLNEGEFVEIAGSQSFAGTKFKVILESISSTGEKFTARFRLETGTGTLIEKRSFMAQDDLEFEDQQSSPVTFDGVLSIQGIYAG